MVSLVLAWKHDGTFQLTLTTTISQLGHPAPETRPRRRMSVLRRSQYRRLHPLGYWS